MTLGMCDNVDTKAPGSKERDRPQSALGNAYERIRQFVRPKSKPGKQTEPKTKEHEPQKQDAKKGTQKISNGAGKLRGLAHVCERQRSLREEQTKSASASKNHQPIATARRPTVSQRGKLPGKRRRRRAYERDDSEDSSSDDSDDDRVDNRDLWFLTGRGIELEKKLGQGTYAQVHAGRQLKPLRSVAVKIISLEKTNQRYRVKFLPREIELLRKVEHPNVIKLFMILKYEHKVFFVTELAQRGDLLGYIQRHKVLSVPVARTIFSQILAAIEYLHQNGIYHRDLKCENILLDPGHKVKLTDFGFAREWYEPNELCRTYCGSAAYASPEILQGLPYEPSTADIWSMGIVLFVMVQGRMPFDDTNVKQMVSVVLRYDVGFVNKRPLCSPLKALIRSILNHDQWKRATIGQIRRSPWLESPTKIPSIQ
ncbi:testis-specific serine/threonine-protein kinase 6-like [Acanthaster planci]|uniref:Testis-specific serine/threonine-protein kinase 6-like n=1 Tax=Acanthaster planci TaxID=133434 RepID=A0A8B7YV38_ACAPL|nr:testis-specific serine/threonine-protein kinase 6-like [Acanthaster planci]